MVLIFCQPTFQLTLEDQTGVAIWTIDKEAQYGVNNHYVAFGVWVKGTGANQILDNFDAAAATQTGQMLKEIAYSFRTASTMVQYSGASTGAAATTYLAAT